MSSAAGQDKNLYELLGVERNATTEQIREVYHEIARVYHPDSHFYDEIAPAELSSEQIQMFKIITAAYNTLTDEKKRLEYDQKLTQMILQGKLRDWEEGNDEFFSATANKYNRSSVSSRNRRMTGTFGRAEILSQILEEDTDLDEMKSSETHPLAPSRARYFLVASLLSGCLFGGILFYILFLHRV